MVVKLSTIFVISQVQSLWIPIVCQSRGPRAAMQWRSLGEFPIFKETGNGQEGKEEGQEEGRQEKEEESITTLGRCRRDVTPGPSARGSPVPMRPTIEI